MRGPSPVKPAQSGGAVAQLSGIRFSAIAVAAIGIDRLNRHGRKA